MSAHGATSNGGRTVAVSEATPLFGKLRGERVAGAAFKVYVAVAWLCLITVYRSKRWFWLDDWHLLAGRDGGDLFEPYNGHLLALPTVIYRVMLNAVGLRWTAFLVVVATMHIALVCVVRVVMRRSGASPWTSTIAAGVFALYGAGEEVLLWPFLVERVGAVLFGLLHLIMADHEGSRSGRRDAAGLLFGLLAILSSGTALVVVAATGVVCLVRHGSRRAALHTVPLAAVYLTWYVIAAPYEDNPPRESLGETLRFAWAGVITPLRAITQNDIAAIALASFVAVGLALTFLSMPANPRPREWAQRYAVPLTLLLACPTYYLVVAQGRTMFGLDFARGSRYLYVGTALVLPAIAVATEAVARRARPWHGAGIALLLVGVPANVRLLSEPAFGPDFYEHERQLVLGIARDPLLDSTPGWVQFNMPPVGESHLTVEWLRDARDRGWLPYAGPIEASVASEFPVRLGVAYVPSTHDDERPLCEERTEPLDLEGFEGDRIWIDSAVTITLIHGGEPQSAPVGYGPTTDSNVLTIVTSSIEIRLSRPFGAASFGACLEP